MAAVEAGKAAVAVVTREFEALAHSMAANAGRPGLRVHVLPYPLESLAPERVAEIAAEHYPKLMGTLGAQA
ncbi:MAG: hypothetical protein J4G09_10230 [Proteobacteria bacterium]|nr:hypothetical protein [Pseudomonadota bacterium]